MKTNRPTSRQMLRGGLAAPVIVLVALVLAGFAFLNRQAILDHITVWQFHPSSQVTRLATDAGMSAQGRFLYETGQPQIDSRTTFNNACRNKDTSNAILGCYTNDRIYIFHVTDARLNGIETVTAAHEMLHAAYARLSPTEQKRVDSMVEAAYSKLKSRDDLQKRMAVYAKTEPGERDNELHSVLGTEVAQLPHDLEAYYKRYFTDRSKVVAAHMQYQAVFTKLQNEAATIQKQMDALQNAIESGTATYTSDIAKLSRDIQSFNQQASNGGFTSQRQFADQRAALVARSAALETRRRRINSQIEQFNALNAKLADVAKQDQSLNQSINSQLPPPPGVKG